MAGRAILIGTKVTGALPAEAGEATVTVANSKLFKEEFGAWHKVNPDVVVCALGANGKPNAQNKATWLDKDTSFTNNVQAQVGFSVFLPFSWEYRLPK